jgi:hypothetical protein
LGQRQDFSALVLLERTEPPDGPCTYALRHAERAPLNVSYTAIAAWVRDRLARDPVRGNVRLVADETGVGLGVIELLRQAQLGATIVPVQITAGSAVTEEETPNGPRWRVAKSALISVVDALFDSGRLTIAAGLKDRPTLLDELRKFQRRFTAAANEQWGSWREGTHDDYVLALALACWYAEQNRPAHVWFLGGGPRADERESPFASW